MEIKDYARQVEAMMTAQRRYFAARKANNPQAGTLLREAQKLEKQVFDLTVEILLPAAQANLFDAVKNLSDHIDNTRTPARFIENNKPVDE